MLAARTKPKSEDAPALPAKRTLAEMKRIGASPALTAAADNLQAALDAVKPVAAETERRRAAVGAAEMLVAVDSGTRETAQAAVNMAKAALGALLARSDDGEDVAKEIADARVTIETAQATLATTNTEADEAALKLPTLRTRHAESFARLQELQAPILALQHAVLKADAEQSIKAFRELLGKAFDAHYEAAAAVERLNQIGQSIGKPQYLGIAGASPLMFSTLGLQNDVDNGFILYRPNRADLVLGDERVAKRLADLGVQP